MTKNITKVAKVIILTNKTTYMMKGIISEECQRIQFLKFENFSNLLAKCCFWWFYKNFQNNGLPAPQSAQLSQIESLWHSKCFCLLKLQFLTIFWGKRALLGAWETDKLVPKCVSEMKKNWFRFLGGGKKNVFFQVNIFWHKRLHNQKNYPKMN